MAKEKVDEAIDDLEEIAEDYDLDEHDWSSVDDASDYLFEHKVKKAIITQLFSLKKSWYEVLKIKDKEGNLVRMEDYDRFLETLRQVLNSVTLKVYGEAGRKSYVRINKNPENYNIWISGRHMGSRQRFRYDLTFGESEDGDFTFLTVTGPGLNLRYNDVLAHEEIIISKIAEAFLKNLETNKQTNIIPKKTTGKTQADINRELEEANPGYKVVDGKLMPTEEEQARLETLGRRKSGRQLSTEEYMNVAQDKIRQREHSGSIKRRPKSTKKRRRLGTARKGPRRNT